MIQITPHMRILVAVEPIDFRAGIDGLAAACRKRLEADPFSGALFVFRNRARTAIKSRPCKIQIVDGLVYDAEVRHGMCPPGGEVDRDQSQIAKRA